MCLPFFTGIAVFTLALRSWAITWLLFWSWELDQGAVAVIDKHFPDGINKGGAEDVTAAGLLGELERQGLPDAAVLSIEADPPCKDHSRARGSFAEFVRDIIQASRWTVVYRLQHMMPQDPTEVEGISEILGCEPIVADPGPLVPAAPTAPADEH